MSSVTAYRYLDVLIAVLSPAIIATLSYKYLASIIYIRITFLSYTIILHGFTIIPESHINKQQY